jgi:Flp pilus assembly protein CpaB
MMKRLVLTIVILALAGTAGYFGYNYRQSQKEVSKLSDPKVAAAKQVSDLVAKVGKLVRLPTGETPTIATVTDLNKLKGQTFFANAQNNDQVLIYTQAKRAVLYRPSENKVLEIAPLSIGNTGAATPSTTVPEGTSSEAQTPSQ